MSRDTSRPQASGTNSRPDIDTFRPAAGDAEDAYSAETVVKAIPRELLADLAAALKAPPVPNLGGTARAPAAKTPNAPAAKTPIAPAAKTPMVPAARTPFAPSARTPFAPAAKTPMVPAVKTPLAPTPKPGAVEPVGDDDATVIDARVETDVSALDFESPSEPPPVAAPMPASVVSAAMLEAALANPEMTQLAPPSSPEAAPLASDVDENTDFRAGTRWPWVTAIVIIALSFAVTLAVLRNL
jgi:hypothetical protein